MTPSAPYGGPRSGAWIAGLAVAYGLLAVLSLLLAARPGQIATLWFANPVGVVALLALQRRQWPAMLVALGLANLLANVAVKLPAQSLDAATWLSAAAFVPGNCAEMLLGALALAAAGIKAADLQNPFRLTLLYALGALLPSMLSAVAGAALVASPEDFGRVWATWLAGSLIGNVAVLPLALLVWLQGPQRLLAVLADLKNQALLWLAVGATLVSATTLPHPFVMVSMVLGVLAATGGLVLAGIGTLLVALTIGLLIGSGILLLPPSSGWWADSLYYSSVLVTLLPGIFLAATVDGLSKTLARLSASEERLRTLYTQTPAMLHSLSDDGRVIDVSQQWLSTLGFARGEVQGRPITDFFTPDSTQVFLRWANPRRTWAGSSTLEGLQMVKSDGGVIDVVLSAIWELDAQGQVVRQLAVVEDVTEKKRLAERSHFAEHDALTGLPNRVLLTDRLQQLCAHHQRHGGQFAVAFIDLDHFKTINDTYGHDAGDLLLKAVATRLQAALRTPDTVARLGGDEFAVLLPGLGDRGALERLANKVLDHVALPCTLGEAPDAPVVEVACSVGLALYPEHGQDAATLLMRADQAMYVSKRGGRNRWTLFSPDGGSGGRPGAAPTSR
ncbi:diguanylate cyclase domain-containing protein [Acidovorax sp.]|uniref:diguanylate cyclase domain-containing protein n=1 Tax=Acidovorax sp. TaxID=1872122 RepID=UPI00391FA60E